MYILCRVVLITFSYQWYCCQILFVYWSSHNSRTSSLGDSFLNFFVLQAGSHLQLSSARSPEDVHASSSNDHSPGPSSDGSVAHVGNGQISAGPQLVHSRTTTIVVDSETRDVTKRPLQSPRPTPSTLPPVPMAEFHRLATESDLKVCDFLWRVMEVKYFQLLRLFKLKTIDLFLLGYSVPAFHVPCVVLRALKLQECIWFWVRYCKIANCIVLFLKYTLTIYVFLCFHGMTHIMPLAVDFRVSKLLWKNL